MINQDRVFLTVECGVMWAVPSLCHELQKSILLTHLVIINLGFSVILCSWALLPLHNTSKTNYNIHLRNCIGLVLPIIYARLYNLGKVVQCHHAVSCVIVAPWWVTLCSVSVSNEEWWRTLSSPAALCDSITRTCCLIFHSWPGISLSAISFQVGDISLLGRWWSFNNRLSA